MERDFKSFLLQFKHKFNLRQFIIKTFLYTETTPVIELPSTVFENLNKLHDLNIQENLRPASVIKSPYKNKMYYLGVLRRNTEGIQFCLLNEYDDKKHNSPVKITDTFILNKGEILNFNNNKSITTTAGRFLFNQLVIVEPFGELIDYINEQLPIKAVEKKIVELIYDNKITSDQFYKYLDNLFFIGHFTELCVPSVSEKSFVTNPKVKEIKKKLLEKYKDKLNDPLVVMEIENELIKLDKEWLKGDKADRFYSALGSKMYNINRKKMHLMVGGIEAFSDDVSKIDFLAYSLSEGWDPKDMPIIANEIRKGSFNRGKETQKGGAQAKDIIRIFQDVLITEDDCKTKIYFDHLVTDINSKDLIGRYIVENGKLVKITKDNINKYINKTVKLRSPMTCKTKNGLCKICVGDRMAKLDHKAVLGMALDLSSAFTTMSLKNMHGTKLTVYEVDPYKFII